jgi:hypothetical protein
MFLIGCCQAQVLLLDNSANPGGILGFLEGQEHLLQFVTLASGSTPAVVQSVDMRLWPMDSEPRPIELFVKFWGAKDVSMGAGYPVQRTYLGGVHVTLDVPLTGGAKVWVSTGDISAAGIVIPTNYVGVEAELAKSGTFLPGNPANYCSQCYIRVQVDNNVITGAVNEDEFYIDGNWNGIMEAVDVPTYYDPDLGWLLTTVDPPNPPFYSGDRLFSSQLAFDCHPSFKVVGNTPPTSVTFTGTVVLSGWMGTSLPPIEAIVDGSPLRLVQSLSGAGNTGTFTLKLPATGSHTVRLKALNSLSVTKSGITPTFNAATFNLQCGDNNNDNVIDDFDFNAVITNFGSGDGGDGNGDLATDDFDFNLVITNFGSVGS